MPRGRRVTLAVLDTPALLSTSRSERNIAAMAHVVAECRRPSATADEELYGEGVWKVVKDCRLAAVEGITPRDYLICCRERFAQESRRAGP